MARLAVTGGLTVALAAMTGCGATGAGMTNEQAEQVAHQIISENAAKQPASRRATVNDVRCVSDADRRWSCLVDVTSGGVKTTVGISMTCDETGYCITKPDQ